MIVGYCGLIGNGKTMLSSVAAEAAAHRRGAILASNILVRARPGVDFRQLAVGEDGFDLDELRELTDQARASGRGVVLLIDEIGILMPARFWQTFPIDLMYQFSQSRKLGLDVFWTSQDVEDVDAYLRRKTQWIYTCRAWPTPSIEKRERGRRPLLYLVSRWRPASVDKPTKRLGRDVVRYRRAWEALYDTDELVRPPLRLRGKARRGSGAAGGGQRNGSGVGGPVKVSAPVGAAAVAALTGPSASERWEGSRQPEWPGLALDG